MIALLGLLAVALGVAVIAHCVGRGRLFTMLSFHAALFMLEAGGGALKAMAPEVFPDFASTTRENPLPLMSQALGLYIAGFVLMLYGYAVASSLARRSRVATSRASDRFFDRRWSPEYEVFLFLATVLTLAVGFLPLLFRLRAVGVAEFLATAYRHRVGTSTTTQLDTTLVVVGGVLGFAALPLMLVWAQAWLRGRLAWMGKSMVVVLGLALLLRQYSSLYRAVILLSLVALLATYASERRISGSRWLALVAGLGGVFVGVNFVHLLLYHLTAGWDRQSLLQTTQQFLAPHGHLYTLATILGRLREGAPTLNGEGLLDTLLFFVPRALWEEKLPSGFRGHLLVQAWAGLPTHYHMAPTTVGEWVAHFGHLGIGLTFVNGLVVGWLDSLHDRGPVLRAALFGILLVRVLPDAGMGLGAQSMTCVLLVVFVGVVAAVDGSAAIARWLLGTGDAARPPMAATAQPRLLEDRR